MGTLKPIKLIDKRCGPSLLIDVMWPLLMTIWHTASMKGDPWPQITAMIVSSTLGFNILCRWVRIICAFIFRFKLKFKYLRYHYAIGYSTIVLAVLLLIEWLLAPYNTVLVGYYIVFPLTSIPFYLIFFYANDIP